MLCVDSRVKTFVICLVNCTVLWVADEKRVHLFSWFGLSTLLSATKQTAAQANSLVLFSIKGISFGVILKIKGYLTNKMTRTLLFLVKINLEYLQNEIDFPE